MDRYERNANTATNKQGQIMKRTDLVEGKIYGRQHSWARRATWLMYLGLAEKVEPRNHWGKATQALRFREISVDRDDVIWGEGRELELDTARDIDENLSFSTMSELRIHLQEQAEAKAEREGAYNAAWAQNQATIDRYPEIVNQTWQSPVSYKNFNADSRDMWLTLKKVSPDQFAAIVAIMAGDFSEVGDPVEQIVVQMGEA